MTSPPSEHRPLFSVENYKPEESVGYLIKRVKLAFNAAVDREMGDSDISYEQWGILLMVARGRCATAAELSREMASDTGSMTRMIDRLEAKNLVRRTRSEDDRRIIRLALTESGQSLADEMPAVLVRVMNRHLAGFSEHEVEQLTGFLRRILENAAAAENDPE